MSIKLTQLSYVKMINFLFFIYEKKSKLTSVETVISKQAQLPPTQWVVRKDYTTKQKITVENGPERNHKEHYSTVSVEI